MIAPLYHVGKDDDDKHVKRRVWRTLRGRRLGSVFARAALVLIVPASIVASLLFTGRTAAGRFQLALVLIISGAGLAFETLRALFLRGPARLLSRIPFPCVLFILYVTQLLLLFGPSPDFVSATANNHRGQQQGVPELLHLHMRGAALPLIISPEAANATVGRIAAEKFIKEPLLIPMTVEAHKERCKDGVLSVVLAAHEEFDYMERTLESLVNSTLPGLLREIIIIDDGSSRPLTETFNTTKFSGPLVRVIRNAERQGLIRSKLVGGNESQGSVIVFLDAHVKPEPGWATPILRNINSNYKRVVVPRIPILDGKTWQINRDAVGEKMMFDWDMSFHWFHSTGVWVPCMSGGLLAISKKWWHESGTLDEGMQLWGAENIEQSVRIWLCGGEIMVAPDCVIGHVFRKNFPYPVDNRKVIFNRLRTVEVWFDEFKESVYRHSPSLARLRPHVSIPFSGRGETVDPEVDQSPALFNISQRVALRERLKCEPFRRYVERFSDVFADRNMIDIEGFRLQHVASGTCATPSGAAAPATVTVMQCNSSDGTQIWRRRQEPRGLENVALKACLDAVLGKRHSAGSASLHQIEVYACQGGNLNQEGWKVEHGRITYNSECLTVDNSSESPRRRLSLTRCSPDAPDQAFERIDERIYTVDEVKAWRP